ncbi:hypothetical protein AMTRI_Chr04g189760 [Amborella trichopoda]
MHQSKVHMIPIFYDVRPSEVRRTEQGVFRSPFEEAEKSMQKEEWKFFLQKTGYLSGWKFSDFRGCHQWIKHPAGGLKYPLFISRRTDHLATCPFLSIL